MSGQYRKKPVVVEAVEVTAADYNGQTWDGFPFSDNPSWLFEALNSHKITVAKADTDYAQWDIHTLEGVMRASAGDWIIKGVKGEVYPCKPDIFAATYEPASAPNSAAGFRTALENIIAEYRAHDAAGIDVMYQIAADALASPQPQGADSEIHYPKGPECPSCQSEMNATCPKCGCGIVTEATLIASLAHPQLSGDGLSEEMLREMLAIECDKSGHNNAASIMRHHKRYDESHWCNVALKFARAVEARVRSAPTDEWRRAVEACARVAVETAARFERCGISPEHTQYARHAAAEIRALSTTKPDDGAPMPTGRKETR